MTVAYAPDEAYLRPTTDQFPRTPWVAFDSRWFPIAGAARASGVSYGLSLEFVAAEDDYAARPIIRAIREAHGDVAYHHLTRRLRQAVLDGRLVLKRWRR